MESKILHSAKVRVEIIRTKTKVCKSRQGRGTERWQELEKKSVKKRKM